MRSGDPGGGNGAGAECSGVCTAREHLGLLQLSDSIANKVTQQLHALGVYLSDFVLPKQCTAAWCCSCACIRPGDA